jgi:hypothetical protein
VHGPGQPTKGDHGRRIRPVHVIHDEHGGRPHAQFIDEGQHPLGSRRDKVDPVARCQFGPEHVGDAPPAVPVGSPAIEGVQQWEQRERLAQLIADGPVDLAAAQLGLRGNGADQRRLADARLALNQRNATPAGRQFSHPGAQVLQLALPADRRSYFEKKRLGHVPKLTADKRRQNPPFMFCAKSLLQSATSTSHLDDREIRLRCVLIHALHGGSCNTDLLTWHWLIVDCTYPLARANIALI